MSISSTNTRLSRLVRTLRHLRWSQIAARGYRVARVRLPNWRDAGESPESTPNLSTSFPVLRQFACPEFRASELVDLLESGKLCLVNRTLSFSSNSPDWRLGPQDQDRLWAITLHYHAWLYELAKFGASASKGALNADSMFRSLLADWLRSCRLGEAGVESLAWNSYAIATRLGWWARTWHELGPAYWERHAELAVEMLQSMDAQARYLASHIEWDLRANHLLRDAVGLAWAGRFFAGRESDRWLRTAARIAVGQADEQMLDDGGHFERSPFYHLEVMNDWMSLALLLRDESVRERMRQAWQQAAGYARWLCHPDGRVAQFNDGAASHAAPHLALAEPHSLGDAIAAGRGGRWLKDSGVVAWHGNDWDVFWDVGEVGPDYQPGHAHADTLTFEASYRGHRLFVDPGCYSYDHDERRKYDRSTLAHNTVCVDQQDSSEVWHIFRVGRRARPHSVSVRIGETGFEGSASHTGYDHLPGRPRHHRRLSIGDQDELQITDCLTGTKHHEAEGGLLLDPAWEVRSEASGWLLSRQGTKVKVLIEADQPITKTTESRPHHPDYGTELETKRLTWRFAGQFPLTVKILVRSA